jgi:hypothetical protein
MNRLTPVPKNVRPNNHAPIRCTGVSERVQPVNIPLPAMDIL